MRRREFITLLGGGAATWPLMASAQHAATPVIGYLDPRSPDAAENRLRGFHRGLKDAGYIEGENITIVYRWAEDRVDRLPLLAGELVSRSVAAIVAAGVPTTFAAKAATMTIPIVFLVGNDPVELGLVGSLSRPAGNLTGIDIFTSELAAKRLEVLRDLLPKATRMGVLVNPADAGASDSQLKEIEAAALAMGLQIKVHNADTRAEIDAAFEAMDRDRPDAVFCRQFRVLERSARPVGPIVNVLSTPRGLRAARLCRGWRPDKLWFRHYRFISSGRSLCWPRP